MRYKTLSEVGSYVSEKINVSKLRLENYISTENMISNRGGISLATKLPSVKTTTAFQKGDILISNIRPYFKKIWLADKSGGCSNDVLVIRSDSNFSNRFLYYVLSSDTFFDYAVSTSKGTKMPRGDKSSIMKYTVPLFSLEEQELISDILKSYDEKIKLNKQINHHLLEQARLLYKNLISSNDTKYQNLSDIARITMGQSPKGETYNDDKIGLPLLNGATDFRNSISPSKWTSDPRKIARPGEYVFGVRATIGLTTKIFKEYAIGRGTGSAKPISNIFDEYLFFALEDLFDYYANLGSGTVYINISKSDFDSFKVILPIKDQFLVDFHKTVQPLFNLIFNNNAEIQKLSELRDCLLPKLLSGEISINQATK
ncbi:restriction endonuclease subunit S [Streptococcus suis]|uniref:restriction endonuclease subunit S n=1 Tax=Streptococcus suis TaxID=1307 RepID=UPI000941E88C|nr:restriction endonuclease subunit S [Streptococcus suis]MBS8066819.1 restriction endonuclease subunit S [Streptococcus suis]MCB2861736.1 restriction endonuclease subunit S [Streptococcus suis]MCL4938530.1 restriction endonuclease subunit S [Streptococcus suis]MCS0684535.1 restriction endonuclease subunit S [Streptococcus suis]HEL1800090.1 restriction endonuclease subunit S [Streptococcus suis]